MYALVEERDVDPETVADRYDLDVAGTTRVADQRISHLRHGKPRGSCRWSEYDDTDH